MKTRFLHLTNLLVLIMLPITISGVPVQFKDGTYYGALQHAEETDSLNNWNSSPIMFIENAGQFSEPAHFYIRGTGHDMWLSDDGFWTTLIEPMEINNHENDELSPASNEPISELDAPTTRKGVNIKLSFVGAEPHPDIQPFNRLDTRISYFWGNEPNQWRSDVPVWGGVRYIDLYPGIDLELFSEGGRLLQRLIVNDTSQLPNVQMKVEGANSISVEEYIARFSTTIDDYIMPLMLLSTPDGTYLDENFFSRELENKLRPEIIGDVINTPFIIDSLINDPSLPLSDSLPEAPTNLLCSTFLGGAGDDRLRDLAIDENNNIYLTGWTSSSDFPTSPGAFDTTYNGGFVGDVFIVKFNPDCSNLLFATYLGGSNGDVGASISVDSTGNAYVVGSTNSPDFPATTGAFDVNLEGSDDTFVTKLSSDGSSLVYSTYVGGSDRDSGADAVLDGNGHLFVTGLTYSSDFPITPDAFDFYQEGVDAYVIAVNGDGSNLLYSTFLGGSGEDSGKQIAVNEIGEVFVSGTNIYGDFPVTPGAFDTTPKGCFPARYAVDVFVTRFTPGVNDLTYATYLGGSCEDTVSSMAIDEDNNVYLTGKASSNFPTTTGAFDPYHNGYPYSDAYVSKLDSSGSYLIYSTFLGGMYTDEGESLVVDELGNAYVVGYSESPDFPITPNAYDRRFDNVTEVFVGKINRYGTELLYSSYLGDKGDEWNSGIVIDNEGYLYIAGTTTSEDFPTTPNAYDRNCNGSYCDDIFVTKLSVDNSLTYSIRGRVTDETNNPSAGVTVTASGGGMAVTDYNGFYNIPVLLPGTYTLRASKFGYRFSPPSITTGVPPDGIGNNFTAIPDTDTSPANTEMISRYVGDPGAFDVYGQYAYVNVGTNLVVLDISTPSSPSVLGETELLQDRINDIEIQGEYAYVVASYGGFHIYDISNPQVITETSYWLPSNGIGAIDVEAGFAYIGVYSVNSSYIVVFDVTNPYDINMVSSLSIPGSVRDISINDSYAYVAGTNGLTILDVTNPYSPNLLGHYDAQVYSVDIDNNFAYLATDHLVILDVADPGNPTEVGSYFSGEKFYDVVVYSSYAFLTEVSDSTNGTGGLRIVDISNPIIPIEVGFYETPTSPYNLDVNGNFAYTTSGGFRIIDISNLSNPTEAGSYIGDQLGSANRITVDGSHAYICGFGYYDGIGYISAVHIVNIENPASPFEEGYFEIEDSHASINVQGNYLYVEDYAGPSGWVLRIIEVSNPSNPIQVGQFGNFDRGDVKKGVAVAGDYALVLTDYGEYLRIIDISNPATPFQVGLYFVGDIGATNMAVSGDHVFITDHKGIQIVDISNPAAPIEVAYFGAGGAVSVSVQDNYAFIATDEGMVIVDVSNPANPKNMGYYDTPARSEEIAVEGNFAYLADYLAPLNLRTIDITNPAAPTEVGHFRPVYVNDVDASGGLIYVVDGYNGLLILRPSGIDDAYSISGRITDQNGYGIPGVLVSAGGIYEGITDINGYYTITDIPDMTYYLTPFKSGYTFTPPSRTLSVPPNATGQDFSGEYQISIKHIEVTQVIQDVQNYVPLIAEKPAFVRVYLDCGTGCTSVQHVTGGLEVSGPSGSTSLSPINNSITVYNPSDWTAQRDDLNNTLNFIIPWDLLSGLVTFTARVGNASLSETLPFIPAEKLLIAWVPIYFQEDPPNSPIFGPDRALASRSGGFIYETFPLGLNDFEYYEQPIQPSALTIERFKASHEYSWSVYLPAVDRLWILISSSNGWIGGQPTRLFGWYPESAFTEHLCGVAYSTWGEVGLPNDGSGRVAIGTTMPYCENKKNTEVFAHEIGHLLGDNGLKHIPCPLYPHGVNDYPNELGLVDDWGVDFLGNTPRLVSKDRNHIDKAYDIMSACSPYWMSKYNYEKLVLGFEDYSQQKSNPNPLTIENNYSILSIIGTVYTPTLDVDFGTFYPLSSLIGPDEGRGTDYCLELRDSSQTILDSRCFDLSFTTPYSGEPIDAETFTLALPYPENTQKVVLTHLGTKIGEVSRSEHSPIVQLLSPNGGEVWDNSDTYTVTWTADDQDGDQLNYMVSYSKDNGATWIPLATDIKDNYLQVDSEKLPGSTNARIKVTATDQMNTGEDISEAPFTVFSKGPSTYIVSPETGKTFPSNLPIYLQGYAYDLEDGALIDNSLHWTSDRDGFLGSGKVVLASLSPGLHLIALSATDSDSNRSTDSINIYIGHKIYLPVATR